MRLGRFTYLFQNRALVLMYHRISTSATDPWDLSVNPGNFQDHLIHLKRHFNVISAEELVHQAETGKIRNRSVVITFDDGYLDNYVTAKPLLEKYSLPASFFITDSNLGGGQAFWWDELESVIVHAGKLPGIFSIPFRDETIHFDLGGETVLTGDLKKMQAGFKYNKLPTLRTRLYLKLWHLFSPLRKDEQLQLMRAIREWAGICNDSKSEQSGKLKSVEGTETGLLTGTEPGVNVCMSQEQVKDLSFNPLFTIGGHTRTHPSLSDHPHDVQFREIAENRQFLQNLTGREITLFAYPSGKYNSDTIGILKESGYKAAFTTNPGPLSGRTDLCRIKRYQVRDLNGEQFKKALVKWIRS